MAFGLTPAFLRALSAIWASCSRVVPNSWKCRWANIAIQVVADGAAKGRVHCMKPPARKLPPPPPPGMTADRPCFPWALPSYTLRKHSTWVASPAATARHASITDPS